MVVYSGPLSSARGGQRSVGHGLELEPVASVVGFDVGLGERVKDDSRTLDLWSSQGPTEKRSH